MGLLNFFKRRHSEEDRREEDYVWDDDDSEALSVYEAASIWASNGKYEDYTFGYTEEELEDALRQKVGQHPAEYRERFAEKNSTVTDDGCCGTF